MDNLQVCPECNKPYKHLMAHLKNKHAWEVEDIFNSRKSNDAESSEQDTARKVSETELEVESTVRRSVDRAIMMIALSDLNMAIRDVYEQLEASMKNTVTEARKIYRRVGDDEIDGPRTDVTRRVRELLQPSSQYLRECVLHELCRIANELKVNITEQL